MTLESEDGAIVGSFENGRADVYSETEAQIRAVADVKQFTGNLQLTGGAGEHLVEQLERLGRALRPREQRKAGLGAGADAGAVKVRRRR